MKKCSADWQGAFLFFVEDIMCKHNVHGLRGDRAVLWRFNFIGIFDERKKQCLEKQIV